MIAKETFYLDILILLNHKTRYKEKYHDTLQNQEAGEMSEE